MPDSVCVCRACGFVRAQGALQMTGLRRGPPLLPSLPAFLSGTLEVTVHACVYTHGSPQLRLNLKAPGLLKGHSPARRAAAMCLFHRKSTNSLEMGAWAL